MNRFDQYSFAQFTPLSAQDILQPVMIQRARHDALDEQYLQLQSEAAQAAYLGTSAGLNSQMRKD